jgi:NADP-dependent 3-hydroxy acid dehydrogenase YdfG
MSRIAFITGASSGIGWATAQAFADLHIDLILCGRRKERLEALQHELSQKVNVQILEFDVRDHLQVTKAIQNLPPDWKNIDILINNAGNAHGLSSIQEGSVSDWDAMIDGNVKGLLYVSKAIMPQMIERRTGHIVNVSSIAGKLTYPNGNVYCASKKAVEAISEGMRLDLTQFGIKVSNVAPGAVETEFSLVRFKGDAVKSDTVYQGFEALQAKDIADAIAYIVMAPPHVTIADMVILPSAQAAPTTIYRTQ